jgi:hypothetical protein
MIDFRMAQISLLVEMAGPESAPAIMKGLCRRAKSGRGAIGSARVVTGLIFPAAIVPKKRRGLVAAALLPLQ